MGEVLPISRKKRQAEPKFQSRKYGVGAGVNFGDLEDAYQKDYSIGLQSGSIRGDKAGRLP